MQGHRHDIKAQIVRPLRRRRSSGEQQTMSCRGRVRGCGGSPTEIGRIITKGTREDFAEYIIGDKHLGYRRR
jgi:hypothetical protein